MEFMDKIKQQFQKSFSSSHFDPTVYDSLSKIHKDNTYNKEPIVRVNATSDFPIVEKENLKGDPEKSTQQEDKEKERARKKALIQEKQRELELVKQELEEQLKVEQQLREEEEEMRKIKEELSEEEKLLEQKQEEKKLLKDALEKLEQQKKLKQKLQEMKQNKREELKVQETDLKAQLDHLKKEKSALIDIEALKKERHERQKEEDEIHILLGKMSAIDKVLDTSPPDWEQKSSHWGKLQEVELRSYTLLGNLDKTRVKTASKSTKWVTLKEQPFAEGGFRFAHYAKVYDSKDERAPFQRMVVKQFHASLGKEKDLSQHLESIEVHLIAKVTSTLFNQRTSLLKIEYVDPYVLYFSDRVMYAEPFLEGEFVKFTNNSVYKRKDKDICVDAFSHFSYQETEGKIMVVDLQGVETGSSYVLTDPSIHSKTPKYGKSNLLEGGFTNFFENHVCNRVCKALNLSKR